MRGAALFVAGVVVGVVMTHTGVAQDSSPRALSHVGIAVKDFDKTLGYYTKPAPDLSPHQSRHVP